MTRNAIQGLHLPALAPVLIALFVPAAQSQTPPRSGSQVVAAVCSSCHDKGANNAPRIGDRAAWIPRMSRGIEALTLSAIRGHAGMPPRGGHAEFTDSEIQKAIAYMWDPTAEARLAAAGSAPKKKAAGPNEATVGKTEIRLGFVPAKRLAAYPPNSVEARMHGGVPSGDGYYHVNISLTDETTRIPIANAQVEVDIVQPGMAKQSHALEPVVIAQTPGYGNYFRLAARTPSTITVHVKRPESPRVLDATFRTQTE